MRPPHWLDGVIGELRDVDDIALAIAENEEIGREAIKLIEKQHEDRIW